MATDYLLNQNGASYYYQTLKAGYYQFTSLDDIINQFMVSYVGEDKLIPKAKRFDVAFHAQRALAELSFDTFKSLKAQELTVPNSLKIPVPHDYVNYTKVVWTDSAGIEHPIYPTSKTSNPQFKGNLVDFDSGHFTTDASNWTLGDGFSWTNQNVYGGAIVGGTADDTGILTKVTKGTQIKYKIDGIKHGASYHIRWRTHAVEDTQGTKGKFKIVMYGEQGYKSTAGRNTTQDYTAYTVGGGNGGATINLYPSAGQWEEVDTNASSYFSGEENISNTLMFEVVDQKWLGVLDNVVVVESYPSDAGVQHGSQNSISASRTWSNYNSATPSENQNQYDDDTYWPMEGSRYGLDPQHAQANGSFYIDPLTGFVHFSSNLSGKTVIIKYISDSLGTLEEMQVHKFAEEAMYKWILYGILSTRANVQEYVVRRFKKEKFAAIRTAKLRLSNLKLEELTQILRGKSKQIKH
jgi:hypothetical protein